jgi:hypothetical protein
MKYTLPTSLRRPEQRYAALNMADQMLRADARRQRAQAMPGLDEKRAPQVPVRPRRFHISELKTALAAKRCLQGE